MKTSCALVALLGVVGCYSPQLADCQITCERSQQCPDGLHCVDGSCQSTAGPSVCLTTPTDGLVAWYRLDDGVGDLAVDATANHLDGTVVGGVFPTQGRIGGGFAFDGRDDRVVIGDVPAFDFGEGSFAVTAWARVNANVGDYDWLWDNGGGCSSCPGYSLSLGAGEWVAYVTDGSDAPYRSLQLGPATFGIWQHFALVIDRDQQRAITYRNGVVIDGQNIATLGSLSATNAAQFGNGCSATIDDVRVYGRALSPEDVSAIMNWKPNVAPQVVELACTDDASVVANSPDDNIGWWSYVGIRGSSIELDRNIGYIKFSLAGVESVQRALLALDGAYNPAPFTLYDVADDDWQELTVTYTTRPALGAALTSGTLSADTGPVIIDVTSSVARELAGDKVITFGLYDPSEANVDSGGLSSRDANKPSRLSIVE